MLEPDIAEHAVFEAKFRLYGEILAFSEFAQSRQQSLPRLELFAIMPAGDLHSIMDQFLAWRLAPLVALSAEDGNKLQEASQMQSHDQSPSYYEALYPEILPVLKRALVSMVRYVSAK